MLKISVEFVKDGMAYNEIFGLEAKSEFFAWNQIRQLNYRLWLTRCAAVPQSGMCRRQASSSSEDNMPTNVTNSTRQEGQIP